MTAPPARYVAMKPTAKPSSAPSALIGETIAAMAVGVSMGGVDTVN